MAAADFFQSDARPPFEQHNSLNAPPGPRRSSSSQPAFGRESMPQGRPNPHVQPQPAQYPPPPYQPVNNGQNFQHSVHFAPTLAPGERPKPSSQPLPYATDMHRPNYQVHPAQHFSPYPHNHYVPPEYQHQQTYYPPPSHQHPRPSHSASDIRDRGGYSSDPEYQRRTHKSRPRRVSDNSRSTNADAFLGAAGGGLIGDLIFPGLGTIGGALAGWVGGKDYGKHRKLREEKLDREQERWEKKFRNRGRDQDRERSSHGDGRRRRSYE
ncbi:hypothetical protein PV08_07134 [Exophiala spinifera]|uniref:Uncharacterized protein n=1 Tax=Exophiala spinifera TaxID=91928 RepID=A0A0D1ZND3_9EURO|nr:uncharacterized protein PV08_07134 [Exophiala spinifera]KIW14352.1 hypothetical protein PV08_07134 [Exophiala spinifera]